MKEAMFIVAAPVGAVPKRMHLLDRRFLRDAEISEIESRIGGASLRTRLLQNGWEEVGDGGLHIQFTAEVDASELSCALLQSLPMEIGRSVVSVLTTQGWRSDGEGNLQWPKGQGYGSSYLPPRIVQSIRSVPEVRKYLVDSGWIEQGHGCWFPAKGYSPYLPVTPNDIVRETLACYASGAAVVHLHTRNLRDEDIVCLSDGSVAARFSRQENYIDEHQYDEILPSIWAEFPDAVLNISTSVRGSGADFDSPRRRAPLKPYGDDGRVPQIASFSPGAVRFKAGGGYENRPNFLCEQAAHFRRLGVRPEVEVFNWTILHNAVGPYAEMLRSTGGPVLFMLVAGVDQVGGEDGEPPYDDSLIKPNVRDQAVALLQRGTEADVECACALLVDELGAAASEIRRAIPESMISLLLPGPLQAIVVDVALELGLDGVRVGLEDSLTMPDRSLPGGNRKAAGTHEQVCRARQLLNDKGVRVISAGELRARLFRHGMQTVP